MECDACFNGKTTDDNRETITGRISIICSQRVEGPIGAPYYHNFTQHHYDFIVQKNEVRKFKFKP
jgi:hypothetical protein